MQSYILTYCRLRKREPLIALGYHRGGGGGASFMHPRYPHRVGNIFEHRHLAEMVPNRITTRALSRRAYSTTSYPQGVGLMVNPAAQKSTESS